jgi:DNA-binding response OmpR family regulator
MRRQRVKKDGNSAGKILLVEDEPGIGEICLRVLTQRGFEVDLAANGVIAEDKLWSNKYDVAVLDIRTPLRDGKQLYQYIVEKYPELQRGVIFITGDVMGGETQFFLEKSGRPFLLKPFSPDELVAAVEAAMAALT